MMIVRQSFLLLLLLLSFRSCNVLALQLSNKPLTVTLKIAVDRNGGVVDQSPSTTTVIERFTCDASLDMVHRLRAVSDAVLVGRQTVKMDNPSLLVRRSSVPPPQQQPLRVVLDPQLRLDTNEYQLFTDGHRTLVYHRDAEASSATTLADTTTFIGLPVHDEDDDDNRLAMIHAVCHDLATHRGVQHLMVEGGPATAHAFLAAGRVDRCLLVRATTVAFAAPLPSGLATPHEVQQYGLQQIGTYPSGGGVDEIECWSMDGTWPSGSDRPLSDWP